MLHALLPDRDLPVRSYGGPPVTLNDLGTRIVASGELRVHLGYVSHAEYDDVGGGRFRSAFKLSDELVIIPTFEPWFRMSDYFPWLLGVAPIDYKSRLEAELTRVWGVSRSTTKTPS